MQKHAITGGHNPAMLKPYISGPDMLDRISAVIDLLEVVNVALTGHLDDDDNHKISYVVTLANMTLISLMNEIEAEGLK